MSTVDEPNGLLRYKVERNSDRITDLERWRREVDILHAGDAERDRTMAQNVEELKDGFEDLRKALRNFALTIAGGTVITAVSVLLAVYHP